jgi:hypothetical protein
MIRYQTLSQLHGNVNIGSPSAHGIYKYKNTDISLASPTFAELIIEMLFLIERQTVFTYLNRIHATF